MKQKRKKHTGLIICLVILGILILLGALIFWRVSQELKTEAKLTAMRDTILNTQEVDMKIMSTGEYAKIEKIMKEYYQEYFTYYGQVENNDYIAVFNNVTPYLLTYEAYKLPKLIQGLDTYKEKANAGLDGLIRLLDQHNIENMFHDEQIDPYYFDFYKELMILDTDEELKVSWQDYKEENDNKMNYIKEMLTILNDNPEAWYVENDYLYFNDEELLNQYNYYYNLTFTMEYQNKDYQDSNFM